VVIIMAEAARTTHELSKDNITKRVAAPPIWVSAFDLLCLFPALLLHAVRETPWFIKELRPCSEWGLLFTHHFKVIDSRGGGAKRGFS
jgi:hypothetical protein